MTPDGKYLYVTNFGGASVSAFAVISDGSLRPIGTFMPSNPGGLSLTQTSGIAITPNGTAIYVTFYNNGKDGAVAGFSVGNNGQLTPIQPAIDSGGQGPAGDAISADGRYLYVANSTSGTITTFEIANNGSLKLLGDSMQSDDGAFFIALAPDGSHLYVANSVANTISQFALNRDGSLTPLKPHVSSAGLGPRGVLVSPDGSILFVAHYNIGKDGSRAGTLVDFDINQDGTIAPAAAFVTGGNGAEALAVAPDGADVYVANFGTSDIASFQVCEECILQPLGRPVATGGEFPDFQSIAIVPNQGPTAAFSFSLAGDDTVAFNASGSSDPDGVVARYAWDFGDGSKAADGGPKPMHAYLRSGIYTVMLTVFDNEGCSTFRIFTGQSVICNGSAAAETSHAVIVPP
jgi:6-phosphogluconolactonase (cycloisomerase 2 family)